MIWGIFFGVVLASLTTVVVLLATLTIGPFAGALIAGLISVIVIFLTNEANQ